MKYNFEWDSNKANTNIRKHRVSFERSAEIFLDPFADSIFDDEHSFAKEDRWVTIGKDNNEIVLVINHTFKQIDNNQCNIRIISARKATKKEIKQYNER